MWLILMWKLDYTSPAVDSTVDLRVDPAESALADSVCRDYSKAAMCRCTARDLVVDFVGDPAINLMSDLVINPITARFVPPHAVRRHARA